MSTRSAWLSAVVLAAGRSKRFRGARPKVLQPLVGRPIVTHVLETLRELHGSIRLRQVCLVVPPGKAIEGALADAKLPFKVVYAVQRDPKGTGDATRVALRKLDAAADVLVCAADMPLLRAESLAGLVRARRQTEAAVAVLTAVDGPASYGRILRTGDWITGVVEVRDATPEQLAIREVNTCTYAFRRDALERVLPKLGRDNAQGEYYLTDAVGEMVRAGDELTSVEADPDEVVGANTRGEFAQLARLARERIVADLMDAGVTVIDPETTYVDAGVRCGPDTVLRPNTFLEGRTVIGANCQIGPSVRLVDTTVEDGSEVTFAVAREAKIGPGVSVGPFASLRPGTVLAKGAEVGSFAEMKNAKIGEGVKAHHFSYLGDVTVGRDSNIGAGTITCNYDGRSKHATTIGEETFIGSDTILVAPVRVGSRAYTGAGSVVTRNVRPGELVYGVPASSKERSKKSSGGKGKRKSKVTKRVAKRPVKKKRRA
jgi:bifunctional UDP-N-acetylglucosamine pyrophosphorylase/glucosamine-1-phosphate N-acetyltransferase